MSHAKRIKHKLRKVVVCVSCKSKGRYLDFKRCMSCLHAYLETKGLIAKPVIAKTVGPCKRCGKKRVLADWLLNRESGEKKLWCKKCIPIKFRISMKKGRKEWERDQKRWQAIIEADIAAGHTARVSRKAEAKLQFNKIKRLRGLTAEGNIPLVKRLLREDKSEEQIGKIFRDLYLARGQTNEKWIKARVATYLRIAEGGE